MATAQAKGVGDLPVLEELDSAEFGLDFTWVAEDLFVRPYQGLMRASGGGVVAYRNADVQVMMRSKHVSHRSSESISTYLRATCPVEPAGLIRFYEKNTFSHQQPEHLPLKQLSSRRLTTKSMARFQSAAVEAIEERIALVADGSEIDFVHDFAKPAAGQFWRRALGLTPAEGQRLVELVGDFQLGRTLDADQTMKASDAANDYIELFTAALERSVGEGEHAVLGELVADFESMPTLGKPENACEAFAITLADGFHALGLATAGIVHALLSNPGALAHVRADRTLIEAAFLEGVRLQGVGTFTTRESVDAFEHGGVVIPANTGVLMMWLFANRDPEVFPEPNTYKLDRDERVKQTAFGGGLYVCPGRHTARMFGETAIRLLTEPNVDIVPTGDVTWVAQSSIHEIESMPVAIRRR